MLTRREPAWGCLGMLGATRAAALSRLAMTLQTTFNALLGRQVDLPAMVLAVHVTGLAASVLVS